MAKPTTKTEVATKQPEASSQVPAVIVNKATALALAPEGFGGIGAATGLETVKPTDLLIPRLTILERLSPQLDKAEPDYIEIAEPGDICDVAMSEVFKKTLFLPVWYIKNYLEWAPRSSGKGLVAVHADADILSQCRQDDKQKWWRGPNIVQETMQFYGYNLSVEEGARMCFIPMASTRLKRGRKWLNYATGEKLRREDNSKFTPPFFYRTYWLTTSEESNNDGKWNTWNVERGVSLPEYRDNPVYDWHELKEMSEAFLVSLLDGTARGDLESTIADQPGADNSRSSSGDENGRM